MEVYGRIYGIENMVNHKIYVGRTIKTVKERVQRHRWCKTSLIGRAIRKYGWENFVVVTLEECDSGEALNEAERRWIKRINCRHPNGYNLTDGGEGCLGFHHSEEAKKRMALSKMGNTHTLGYKFPKSVGEAISEKNKNRPPEVHTQVSAAHKKHRLYPNLDAELEKRFITYRGLARLLNVPEYMICNKMMDNSKFSSELKRAIK